MTLLAYHEQEKGKVSGEALDSIPVNDFFKNPRLNGFLEFSRKINLANTLSELLSLTVSYGVQILEVYFCQVYTLEPEGYFTFRIGSPSPELDQPLNSELLMEIRTRGYFQKAIVKDEPMALNIQKIHLSDGIIDSALNGVKSIYLFPMAVGTRPIGILVLGEKEGPFSFTMRDEKVGLAILIANQAANAIFRTRLSVEVDENQMRTVMALAKTLETRDCSIGGHCERIASLAENLARRLNCSEEDIKLIRSAALLHDIGKIGIPDNILQKPDALSKDEWAMIQKHADLGAEIVNRASNLAKVAELIKAHHERFNGTGYPSGIRGEAIPLGARILSVVDAYSAITDGRIYRAARSHEDALQEIKKCSGKIFDPRVVDAFLGMFL
jgi:putative nucleotidyltransferase with HDIG domain